MRQLTNERASLKETWERRNKQLKQCSDLQLFLRDAEVVDSATSAQEAFLANDDLGVRDDVRLMQAGYAWLKRKHILLINTQRKSQTRKSQYM